MEPVCEGGRKQSTLCERVMPSEARYGSKPENGWMASSSVWHERENKCSKSDLMVILEGSLGVQILLVTAVTICYSDTKAHTSTETRS